MNSYEIINTTLKDANKHLEKLNEQNATISKAILQVDESTNKTKDDINLLFENIKKHVLKVLEDKQNNLKKNVDNIRANSIKPLNECRIVIEKEVNKVENYIKLGEQILQNNNGFNFEQFEEESSMLGTLPAVPSIEEFPYISFQYDLNDLLIEFETRINNIGNISKIGPVQIKDFTEKPGACLIEWYEIESEEKLLDIQLYKLQRAYGNTILNSKLELNFRDCYIGNSNQYLSKDMRSNENYSFRVCCLMEGSTIWSAWSRPFVAYTRLEPFMWDSKSLDYKCTSENKIATKISSNAAIIHSKMAQFCTECLLEFMFLECGEINEKQCIGLVDCVRIQETNLIRPGTFMLSATGKLFVDGKEKLTQLPKLKAKTKVTFSSVIISSEKLRITVEYQNKAVTYDWIISDPLQPLFFAGCFEGMPWKILVE